MNYHSTLKEITFFIICVILVPPLMIAVIAIDNLHLNIAYAINKTLNVVTTVSPITNIVENIGGDRINLIGLVPEGVNSHTFEPVPSDIIKLNNADLVIINGLFLEDNIEKTVNELIESNPNIHLLKLADNTVNSAEWVFDFSFPEENGHPNPHVWLNPVYAMKFANLTKEKLVEMDPNNAKYYIENAERFVNLLKKLDEGVNSSIQTIPPENRKLITYHDSWAYFATRYNMTVIGAVQPSDFSEPSPLDVVKIIDQLRIENIPAIFASEVFSNRITDQIAHEAGVDVVQTLMDDALPGDTTSPEHTYVGMMIQNMKNMIIPLGGNIDNLTQINPANTYKP